MLIENIASDCDDNPIFFAHRHEPLGGATCVTAPLVGPLAFGAGLI